jgi:pimeloyl-ACP methyl ester carboxylesterase
VLNYLPRVTIPVLQFNGRYDTDFRFETSAKPFFALIGTPAADKKHVVEPTGHFVPRPVIVGETLNWLDKYLGPATP